jgi:predicted nucleic acid-binding protein
VSGLFVDSFYFIALLNPSDQFHAEAIRVTRDLRRSLVTTRWVLIEVADALCSPALRSRTIRLIRGAEADPNLLIVEQEDTLLARSLDLYEARPDKGWSMTDCLSFVVMADRGLTEALTGDHHFEQAGFRALLGRARPTRS